MDKQATLKYQNMVYVKKAFEELGNKYYAAAYDFMEIRKGTWDKWKNAKVDGILNITRFNEWKNNTYRFLIELLEA